MRRAYVYGFAWDIHKVKPMVPVLMNDCELSLNSVRLLVRCGTLFDEISDDYTGIIHHYEAVHPNAILFIGLAAGHREPVFRIAGHVHW